MTAKEFLIGGAIAYVGWKLLSSKPKMFQTGSGPRMNPGLPTPPQSPPKEPLDPISRLVTAGAAGIASIIGAVGNQTGTGGQMGNGSSIANSVPSGFYPQLDPTVEATRDQGSIPSGFFPQPSPSAEAAWGGLLNPYPGS
jgi:hypothetical protein